MKSGLKRVLVGLLVSSMVSSNALTLGAVDIQGAAERTGDVVRETKETAGEGMQQDSVASETTPETTPETTLETTPEATPETTPEATPETTLETTPETTPEVPAKNETTKFTYEFTDMTVEASIDTPDSLPAGVTLEVLPIWDQSQEAAPDATIQSHYSNFRTLFENQAAEQNIHMLEYLSYTIQFVKDGVAYEPAGQVHITYKYKSGLVIGNLMSDASNLDIYYLDDQSDANELKLGTIADDKKAVTMNADGSRIMELAFDTTSFEQFTIGSNDNIPIAYAYEDDKVTASVTADRLDTGIFGAELQVKPVEKGEAYDETEALLTKQAEEKGAGLGGFLAYDISFVKDGKEVEPANPVKVSLNFKESVKPEGVDSENVALGHIKEEINGNKKLEELTEAAINKTEDAAVESTEFSVDSFSIFTIYWDEDSKNSIGIVRIDEQGKAIGNSEQLDWGEDDIKLQDLVTNEAAIAGYQYVKSTIASSESNAVKKDAPVASKIRRFDNKWQYKKNTGRNWQDINSNKVYMIYQKKTADCNQKVVAAKETVFDIYANVNKSNSGKAVVFKYFVDGVNAPADKFTCQFDANELAFRVDVNSAKYTLDRMEVQLSNGEKLAYENKNPNEVFALGDQKTTVNIYLNKVVVEKLTTIETVDSAAKGVKIEMFDYAGATPEASWGPYTTGSNNNAVSGKIKSGLLKRNLNKNGLPERSDNKGELTASFSPSGGNYKGNANHLFSKSIFDGNGTYSYSSFDNYAYWDQTTKNFKVYNQIGTPSDEAKYFYQRGNFMPFNAIEEGRYSKNTNLYDENGDRLPDGDPREGEKLYRTFKDDKKENNYQFGQVITANFAQPKGGIQSGNQMIYEFNGDDDLWVFVDGVLVLDIGGIHDAHSGYINFATGVVGVSDCATGKDPVTTTTTIKAQFEEAGKDVKNWKSNTFADYSSHKIKIFYMERGAGASNCKMKFNLPVVEEGSINVKKEITNINDGAFSDVLFDFKLYTEDEKGTVGYQNKKYNLMANQPYTLIDADGHTELGKKLTGDDGVFQLKHGQTAAFEKAAEIGKHYFIEETGVTQDQYDKFFINGTEIKENGGEVGGTPGTGFIIRSNPLLVGEDAIVSFGNQCEAGNLKNLTIGKKLMKGQSSEDEYQVKVLIGGEPFTGKYYINADGNVTEQFRKATNEGMITLSQDEFVTIKEIPSGTSFEIQETGLDESKYGSEAYKAEGADDIKTEGKATGTITMGSNATVTITNQQKLSKLVITKEIDQLYEANGDAVFTFKITGPDGKVLYHTMRFTSGNADTIQSYTIENLPFGIYQVEELNTMRYVCQSDAKRTAELKTVDGATVEFVNNREYEDNYSHTDVVVNKIHVNEDGAAIIPDNLKEEKEDQ